MALAVAGLTLLIPGSAKGQPDVATRLTVTASDTAAFSDLPSVPAGKMLIARGRMTAISTAAARAYQAHLIHVNRVARAAALAKARAAALALERAAAKAAQARAHAPAPSTSGGSSSTGCADPSGKLTSSQVRSLWLCAGGPSWAAAHAVSIAWCESGWRTDAYNPSGATGLWQILGSVVPGPLRDAVVNARNAVAKFRASGDTFAQWVCQ